MEPLFILVLVVGAFILAYQWWRHHRKREALATLLARDGLSSTEHPCGLGPERLRRLRACPQGDRRYGVEYGVTGQVELTAGGRTATTECAAFRWWWEVRQTSRDANGHTTTSYSKRTRVVGVVRLLAVVPSVSIAPEGLLARVGLGGRGDFQVESEEFNRRFDIRTTGDPRLVIRLFDAAFQTFLLERFRDRSIELVDDLLLLAGDPGEGDPDLFGDIGRLPTARRDVAHVASRIPASFWRGLGSGGGEPAP